MSIFNKKKRKDKRGIVPVAPERTYPNPSYWETYDGGGEDDPYDRTPVTYETPAPSYDRSPTTYDTPAPSSPSQSYDSGSSGSSGGSYSSDTSSSSSGDSGGGSW